jgi:hypothetical protein
MATGKPGSVTESFKKAAIKQYRRRALLFYLERKKNGKVRMTRRNISVLGRQKDGREFFGRYHHRHEISM